MVGIGVRGDDPPDADPLRTDPVAARVPRPDGDDFSSGFAAEALVLTVLLLAVLLGAVWALRGL